MRIAILSAHEEVLGFIDNDVPNALHYYSDNLHVYLKGNASTFTFTCLQNHDTCKYLVVGNHLVFNWNDRDYYMTIQETEQDEDTIKVIAYTLSLELVNEEVAEYCGKSLSFEEYFNVFNVEKTLTLGLNEVSDKVLTFEWTGTTTLLKRLFSLATEFDAEIEFIPVLNNYALDHIQMNVYRANDDTYQGVGSYHDEIIRYGKEVDSIKKSSDITDMYTAIYPVGKDNLTIESLDGRQVLDYNGNVLYFVDKKIIRAKQAQEQFPSSLTGYSNYIVHNYTYDTDNVETLYGQALGQLKKNCVPVVTYDMDGYVEANIGDSFRVEDTEFNPPLYLKTRVTEMQICTSNTSSSKMVFDNYTELTSEVSQTLLDKVTELAEQAKEEASKATEAVDKSVISVITQYYESTSPTKLDGGEWRDKQATWTESNYIWSRTKTILKNGTIVYSNGSCITGNTGSKGDKGEKGDSSLQILTQFSNTYTTIGQTASVAISKFNRTPVANDIFTAVDGSQNLGTWQVISIASGAITIKLLAYCSIKGSTGATGNGIKSTVTTYQASASGTTTPADTWSSTPPSTSADKPYLWTKVVVTYTDYTTSTFYSIGSTIEGVSVGGRNLVLGTANTYTMHGTNVENQTERIYAISGYGLEQLQNKAETVSISFDWTSTVSSGSFRMTTSGDPWIRYSPIIDLTQVQSGHCTNQISLSTPYDKWEGTMVMLRLDKVDGDVMLSNLKLEIGNQATDWTPAPEDVEENYTTSIGKVNENLNNATTQVNSNLEKISNLETNSATKIDVSNLKEAYAEMDDSITTVNESINALKESVSTNTTKVSELAQVVKVGDDGVTVLEKADSANYAKIQANGMHVFVSDTEVADFGINSEMDNLYARKYLKFGSHRAESYTVGSIQGTAFFWTGGN